MRLDYEEVGPEYEVCEEMRAEYEEMGASSNTYPNTQVQDAWTWSKSVVALEEDGVESSCVG